MDYIKNEGKLLGYHFALATINLTFSSFELWTIGRIALLIIMIVCHICFYYSFAHNTATNNLKFHSKVKPYKLKGLVMGLIHVVVLCALSGVLFLMQKHIYTLKPIYIMIYSFVVLPFKFMASDILKLDWTSAVICASIPFITMAGYYMGFKKINLAEKYIVPFIYKKDE